MRKSGALFKHALKQVAACVPLACLALATQVAHGQQAANAGPHKTLDDLVSTTCSKCHNTTDWAGGLALDTMDLGKPGEEPEVWEKAIGKLRGRLMPPAGEKQPAQADIGLLVEGGEPDIADIRPFQPRTDHLRADHLARQRELDRPVGALTPVGSREIEDDLRLRQAHLRREPCRRRSRPPYGTARS